MEKLVSTPPEYDEAIRRAITTFEEMNQPRFKGYINLSVRPHGKIMVVSEELYCMDKDARSHEKIFERFCALLNKAVRHFGSREFAFEITNMKGDLLVKIRLGTSRRVAAVIQQLEKPEPVAEQEPVPEKRWRRNLQLQWLPCRIRAKNPAEKGARLSSRESNRRTITMPEGMLWRCSRRAEQ